MVTRSQQFQTILENLPVSRGPAAVRQRVEMLERVMENAVTLPVVGRVGADAALGLIPVVGDIVSGAVGAYLVWEARNLGMSKWTLARMSGNVAFDTAIGFVPFLGDALDVVFRSNSRNLRMLKRHLDKHHPATAVVEGERVT